MAGYLHPWEYWRNSVSDLREVQYCLAKNVFENTGTPNRSRLTMMVRTVRIKPRGALGLNLLPENRGHNERIVGEAIRER